jgi:hypothetical protein
MSFFHLKLQFCRDCTVSAIHSDILDFIPSLLLHVCPVGKTLKSKNEVGFLESSVSRTVVCFYCKMKRDAQVASFCAFKCLPFLFIIQNSIHHNSEILSAINLVQ